MVTYDYPPVGGISVQRVVKFAKYLQRFGIRPVVLTNEHGIGFARDDTLMSKNRLDAITTYRLGGASLRDYQLRRNDGRLSTLERYRRGITNLPWMDIYSKWYRSIRNDLISIVENEEIQCVFSTSPPHSTHFFGLHLSDRLGIPWVMDIRDSMTWAPASNNHLHEKLQRLVERHHERRFVRAANAVITISDPMARNIAERLGSLAINKVHVITNGYDDEDYVGLRPEPKTDRRFTIVYTGSLLGKRSPTPLFDALRSLASKGAIDPSRVLLRFVGNFDSEAKRQFCEIRDVVDVDVIEHVPHWKSLSYQLGADLLVLFVTSNTQNAGSEILTGKVFEYMASHRPILAITGPGPLGDIIHEGGFGLAGDYRDIESLERVFLRFYDDWMQNGHVDTHPSTEQLRKYSRLEQARHLAKIIHGLVAR